MNSHIIAGSCWRNPIPLPLPHTRKTIRPANICGLVQFGECEKPVNLWGKRWVILSATREGGEIRYLIFRVVSIADAQSCGIEPIDLGQWIAREADRREISYQRWKGLILQTAAGERVVVIDEWRWVVCRLGEQTELFGGAKR